MELEFYVAKLYYKQGESWRLTFCELKRFDVEADWVLVSCVFENRKFSVTIFG